MVVETTHSLNRLECEVNADADAVTDATDNPFPAYRHTMAEQYPELQMTVCLSRKQGQYMKVKQGVDLLVSILGLVLLAAPLGAIALIQKILSPREPVFFRQERVGQNGKIFRIIKFRTMRSDAPKEIATSQFENPDAYITPFGNFLRRFSIDELPQLVNVLTGEMAIIGPRPLIPSEQPVQTLRERCGVYSVRPGITGLAQINGRDRLDDYAKVWFDRKYVQELSCKQDLQIFIRSFSYILRQRDIGKVDHEKLLQESNESQRG